jgi:hypothetical protein
MLIYCLLSLICQCQSFHETQRERATETSTIPGIQPIPLSNICTALQVSLEIFSITSVCLSPSFPRVFSDHLEDMTTPRQRQGGCSQAFHPDSLSYNSADRSRVRMHGSHKRDQGRVTTSPVFGGKFW